MEINLQKTSESKPSISLDKPPTPVVQPASEGAGAPPPAPSLGPPSPSAASGGPMLLGCLVIAAIAAVGAAGLVGWFLLGEGGVSTATDAPGDATLPVRTAASPPDSPPVERYDPMAASASPSAEVRVTDALASTTLPNWQLYTFYPRNLVDGNLATSWQPDDKQSGAGEWFQLSYAPARVAFIEVANGFQLVDDLGDLFVMNARIGRAELETSSGHRQELVFDTNARGWTRFTVNEQAPSTWVRVTVRDASPGTRFRDLAISEVRLQEAAP